MIKGCVSVVSDVGCERIHKEKKVERVKVLFLLSQGKERVRCRDMHQPQGVRTESFYLVMGWLQSRIFQFGGSLFGCYLWAQGLVARVWYVLFYKFPEPLHLQGASSNLLNLLALRIKVHKTTRVSYSLWGPS